MTSTLGPQRVRALLTGGDRRSIGQAGEVAAKTLGGALSTDGLVAALFDEDAVVRMRAADALEKVSACRPDLLVPHKAELLAYLPEVRQPEVRWHLAQMLPRLDLTAAERNGCVVPVLLGYLQDRSRIVQTSALQALTDLAALDPTLHPKVSGLVEKAAITGGAAVKSRARRLLVQLKSSPEA